MTDSRIKIASGVVVGVVLISGLIVAMNRGDKSAASQALDAANAGDKASGRPGYVNLKTHVEKLAAIDEMCKDQDPSTCYCELAQTIRNEHDAIARLLMDDPALRGFVIAVRQPASETPAQRYDLNKLPQVPDETKCLSTVSAPTLIEGDSQEI